MTALVRYSSDPARSKGAAQRHGDLTDLQRGSATAMTSSIFAAGSGGDTGPDLTDAVDRDGAMRLIDLAKEAGVARFVMLSTIGEDQSDPSGEMAHYLKAKHAADEHLKASGLTHVILRPVALTNEGRSGDVVLADSVDKSASARAPMWPLSWPRPPPQAASTGWRRICNPPDPATVAGVRTFEHRKISGIWFFLKGHPMTRSDTANRKFVLAERPKGEPDDNTLRLETGDVPTPGPGPDAAAQRISCRSTPTCAAG